MSKHTPGPWQLAYYVDSGKPNCGSVIAANPHGEGAEEVASVNWIGGGFYSEQTANARLIAAAPELLDACRLFLMCDEYSPDPAVSKAMAAARAAIAKATAE